MIPQPKVADGRREHGAAPVINEVGRPVGVLSLADIVVHDRESGFHVERPDLTRVRDMMTPAVFSIATPRLGGWSRTWWG